MIESAIERSFVEWCKKNKIRQVKVGLEGWPDRLVLFDEAMCLWLEFKTPTGRLSAIQKVVISDLESCGQIVHVVKSKQEAIDAVLEFQRRMRC